MVAWKTWDSSGTIARVTIHGPFELPAGATLDLECAEIPDGVSSIIDPLALIITGADGRVQRIHIREAPAAVCECAAEGRA